MLPGAAVGELFAIRSVGEKPMRLTPSRRTCGKGEAFVRSSPLSHLNSQNLPRRNISTLDGGQKMSTCQETLF